jgi:hypothetical protein
LLSTGTDRLPSERGNLPSGLPWGHPRAAHFFAEVVWAGSNGHPLEQGFFLFLQCPLHDVNCYFKSWLSIFGRKLNYKYTMKEFLLKKNISIFV